MTRGELYSFVGHPRGLDLSHKNVWGKRTEWEML
jgi:hypothetical protein